MTCRDCGHRLRFGARYCGRCGFHAPRRNWISVIWLKWGLGVLVFAGLALAALARI